MKHYFTLKEFLHSDVARLRGISNVPTRTAMHNLWILRRYVLDPLRHHFKRPIFINSGFRSTALNKAVGGSPNSFHLRGMAVDISVENKDELMFLFTLIVRYMPFTEVILYRHFIHLAFCSSKQQGNIWSASLPLRPEVGYLRELYDDYSMMLRKYTEGSSYAIGEELPW